MGIQGEIMGMIRAAKRTRAPVLETSNLYTDIGLDSLAFVSLLLRIECMYHIEFGLLEMEECLHVGRLIALVNEKMEGVSRDQGCADEPGQHRGHRGH